MARSALLVALLATAFAACGGSAGTASLILCSTDDGVTVVTPDGEEVATITDNSLVPVWSSPSAGKAAYIDPGGIDEVFLVDAAAESIEPIPVGDRTTVRWSSNRFVAFADEDRRTSLLDTTTGALHDLGSLPGASADLTVIDVQFADDTGNVMVLGADDLWLLPVGEPDSASRLSGFGYAEFSPDGERLLYIDAGTAMAGPVGGPYRAVADAAGVALFAHEGILVLGDDRLLAIDEDGGERLLWDESPLRWFPGLRHPSGSQLLFGIDEPDGGRWLHVDLAADTTTELLLGELDPYSLEPTPQRSVLFTDFQESFSTLITTMTVVDLAGASTSRVAGMPENGIVPQARGGPDADTSLWRSRDGEVLVLDTTEAALTPVPGAWETTLAYSPDGERVAGGQRDARTPVGAELTLFEAADPTARESLDVTCRFPVWVSG